MNISALTPDKQVKFQYWLDVNDYTLRIRKKGEKIYCTCKHPIKSRSNGIEGQLEHEEHKEILRTDDLEENQELVAHFLEGIVDSYEIAGELQKRIKVTNYRTKAIVERKSGGIKEIPEKYEVAIDCVEYENLMNHKTATEQQLEIELKSSYQNRINMKNLTGKIERMLGCLTAVDESKYNRALKLTK